MPRRDDLHRILILGSGPIVIGQAAEFDYSGVQACKVLKEEGYEIVLVNSNPATIMTDPEFADATYIEPLLPGPVAAVIERERPDALLPTLGGQTALNLAKALHEDGTLERFGVELIGADYDAIARAEDRDLFRQTMETAGLKMPRSAIATSLAQAQAALPDLGLPCIVRPAFTLGGRGGGIARTHEEYERIVERGLAASPIGQILLDQSVLGWGEFELEVMRDLHDNVVIVCSIENVDPMGVHTGDSVTVAPQQTLTDRLYQRLRDQAIAVIRAVGVETGGSNVQFAVDPVSEEILVIEMNPRVSRSSALASKATGFPIAKIAARLAVGYALEEISNDITQITPASFEPTIDYVVVKWPRFAFEKFPGVASDLSTHMKSVGEAMAIGRTFQQAFAKALRSRELDIATKLDGVDTATLLEMLERPASDRYDVVLEAFRKGASVDDVRERTAIDPWFLEELRALALDPDGALAGERSYKAVDTCAAEFPARTPYYYSGWERRAVHEVERGERPSVVILGSGPNRIGQGIEFDYCCVHAAMTVRESGRDAVMINCNPETVSTDYDTSDRLYFEPLTLEDVLGVIEIEQPGGRRRAVRRPDAAEARPWAAGGRRPDPRHQRGLDRPRGGPRALRGAARAPGLPGAGLRHGALGRRRPGAVRAGRLPAARAPQLRARRARDGDRLLARRAWPTTCSATRATGARSSWTASWRTPSRSTSTPCATARRCGSAGSCSTSRRPGSTPATRPACCPRTRWATRCSTRSARRRAGIALGLGVVGLMNVQYAVHGGALYVIEANPRASRTVPFVSKAIGVPLAKLACRIMLGERIADLGLPEKPMRADHVSVKEAVLPFDRLEGSDAILGPEMRSTGEVMGIARDFPTAFAKAQAAAGAALPSGGTAFITLTDSDKPAAVGIAQILHDHGFRIVATRGTKEAIERMGIPATELKKIGEGSPNVVDWIENGDVDLVVNTPTGSGARSDGWEIRRAAIARGIPCLTTLSGGLAAARAIAAGRQGGTEVLSLQEIHAGRVPAEAGE